MRITRGTMRSSVFQRCLLGAILLGVSPSWLHGGEAARKDLDRIPMVVQPLKSIAAYAASDCYNLPKLSASSAVYTFVDGSASVLLVDVNGDGGMSEDKDLMAFGTESMLVPCSTSVVLPSGTFDILKLDKANKVIIGKMQKEPTYDRNVYEAMYFLNVVRNRNGMAPVRLDLDLSKACDAHAEYVSVNHNQGMGLHKENPGSPKYTKEGAAAAAGSSIYPGRSDLKSAIDGWIRSSWHSWPLMDPNTKWCGVTNKLNMCMFYRHESNTYKPKTSELLLPGKNAKNLPLSFNVGEIPTPVPGKDTASLGMPVIWRSPDLGTKDYVLSLDKVVNGKAEPVDGYFSSPSQPANPREWPTNSGLHLFVPATALQAASDYVMTVRRGKKVVFQSRFTTGNAQDFSGTMAGP